MGWREVSWCNLSVLFLLELFAQNPLDDFLDRLDPEHLVRGCLVGVLLRCPRPSGWSRGAAATQARLPAALMIFTEPLTPSVGWGGPSGLRIYRRERIGGRGAHDLSCGSRGSSLIVVV